MDLYNCLESFKKVVNEGSFTKAARSQNINASAISKQIAWLEIYFNDTLLFRTTRTQKLTESGELVYQLACQFIAQVKNVRKGVYQNNLEPQGNITISAPTPLAAPLLLGLFKTFKETYKKINLQIKDSNSPYLTHEDKADLAFSTFDTHENQVIKRKLASLPRGIFASKSYIEEHGQPTTCRELIKHQCLVNFDMAPNNQWKFKNNKSYQINPYMSITDSGDLLEATIQGMGIGYFTCLGAKKYVDQDLLINIPLDQMPMDLNIFLYHRPYQHGSIIELLSNFIKNYFSELKFSSQYFITSRGLP